MQTPFKCLRFVLCFVALFGCAVEQSVAEDAASPHLLQPGQVLGNNGTAPAAAGPMNAWSAAPAYGRALLFASPTGDDGNNNSCLDERAPCTLKGACTARTHLATFMSGNIRIYLAPGTYSQTDENDALCTVHGNVGGSASTLTGILGDCSAPTAVVLAVPDNSYGLFVKDNAEAGLHCVMVTGGDTSVGILNFGQAAVVDYDQIIWGTWGRAGSHVSGVSGSFTTLNAGGETISANFAYHWSLSGNATFNAAGETVMPSAIAWNGGAFLVASGNNYINLSSWSPAGLGVGGSTGPRAILNGPGYMLTAGNVPCNAALPGNSPCRLSNGFLDSGGDPWSPPSTTFANMPNPGSAGAGAIVHITDGKAANCGDGACTTWSTTVTGGGGSLPLTLQSNGASWTLIGK